MVVTIVIKQETIKIAKSVEYYGNLQTVMVSQTYKRNKRQLQDFWSLKKIKRVKSVSWFLLFRSVLTQQKLLNHWMSVARSARLFIGNGRGFQSFQILCLKTKLCCCKWVYIMVQVQSSVSMNACLQKSYVFIFYHEFHNEMTNYQQGKYH